MRHRHHLIPRHAGGTDDPDNLTPPISTRLHAEFHYDRWLALGDVGDLRAYGLLRYGRNWWSTFSDEERNAINKRKGRPHDKAWRQRHGVYIRQWWDTATTEQINERNQKISLARSGVKLGPRPLAERQRRSVDQRQRMLAQPIETRKAKGAALVASRTNDSERCKNFWRRLTPEQRADHIAKIQAGRQRTIDARRAAGLTPYRTRPA